MVGSRHSHTSGLYHNRSRHPPARDGLRLTLSSSQLESVSSRVKQWPRAKRSHPDPLGTFVNTGECDGKVIGPSAPLSRLRHPRSPVRTSYLALSEVSVAHRGVTSPEAGRQSSSAPGCLLLQLDRPDLGHQRHEIEVMAHLLELITLVLADDDCWSCLMVP